MCNVSSEIALHHSVELAIIAFAKTRDNIKYKMIVCQKKADNHHQTF